jgi:hypothetical protein
MIQWLFFQIANQSNTYVEEGEFGTFELISFLWLPPRNLCYSSEAIREYLIFFMPNSGV